MGGGLLEGPPSSCQLELASILHACICALNCARCTGGCVLLLLPQEAGSGAHGGCTLGVQRRVVCGETLAEEVRRTGQLCVERGAPEAVLHAGDMPGGLQEIGDG